MNNYNVIYQAEGKRPFDFNHPDFYKHRPERIEYLFKNHHKPVTEEEYLKEVRSWPIHRSGKNARKHRTPSNIKYEYRKLVNTYGLFPGGQSENI